jgi:salicylate hydroxylase
VVRIVVAGGGIGGLALAVALGRRGIRCTVLERDRTLGAAGAGLQLSPNGTAVLRRLGRGAALAGAFRPAGRQFRSWRRGGLIGRVPLGREARCRYGDPYVTLRRATLRRLLYEEAARTQQVRLGCAVSELTGAGVALADGSFEYADVVVGADGLNSVVRPYLIADPLRFSGHVAYRAVLPASVFSTVDVVIWLGPGRHCVCYPIDEGRNLNLVATLPAALPPSSARRVRADELIAAYEGWDPTVTGLLTAAGVVDRHPLFERPSPGPRSWGRVTLVGDAALPMLPFLAQGACQALEDAESLARRIAGAGHRQMSQALVGYATERRERAERIAAASRAGARNNHLPDGPDQRRRDRHLAGLTLGDMDWIYGAPCPYACRVPA